ncbi:BREX-1 system adenine-specific DNA-methyltransferase PglX [Aliarcobacter cryaerophilus]|uniref:site-specific DNA-methyltransferase (adenine-specific) n=1 Tax=Aliarcobacter cryaerophilus TaxID=28198 RepID=A0A7G9LRD3_9BACT|nr:BREX-1 system adenine-specific DNA-methyltransferase PglX [Aliarcobacter cryaerophilus]QNM91182.1 BREX-1 system adenine-specific DNA-methyltransferase PglX [Aliarcobacter cryaerophilus]
METLRLKRFAAYARKLLRDTVSTKLSFVLDQNSSARRENPSAVKQLEDEISKTSKEQVIEKVAYIWFNRFVALRFMDANNYTKINVVSPEPSQFQPSILADAKMGHIDDDIVKDAKTREKIQALLSNQTPSNDPQGEAYKLLVVAACNYYNHAMPFLFEKISDYTELLMPDDLLSGDSILAYTREAMTPDVCSDVEVIGWLYQFYIAEKKDEVFEGIKKNKKVTPENIPAATQLFTPNWIVRYMVQNSLGRLWKLNHPDSKLAMEYYIEPETKESDYLKISSPKELKICDPACGSGHILVYAFDLLYEIYKEAGYSDDDDIIENILTNNLYGIEIDERASELASFALTMKAAAKSSSKRRFFKRETTPNICKLEVIKFESDEIKSYMDAVGRDLFTADLQETLRQFEEADNFGSLIVPKVQNVESILKLLESKDVTKDIFLQEIHQRVLRVLKQADYLDQKYHVVVANPPYMGSKGMNSTLISYAKKHFPDSKTDLFSMFIERCLKLNLAKGYSTLITIQNWMFISSFEKLRQKIFDNYSIRTLIQIGFNSFPELNSKFALASSFVIQNIKYDDVDGIYFDLNSAPKSADKKSIFEELLTKNLFYKVNQRDFLILPSIPLTYWVSKQTKKAFKEGTLLKDILDIRQGMATTDNNTYLRNWFEIAIKEIGFNYDNAVDANANCINWFPYNKGGDFRKWFGNNQYVILYEDNGEKLIEMVREKYPKISDPEFVIKNRKYYFKPSITWSFIGLSFGVRFSKKGFIFDVGGSSAFAEDEFLQVSYTGLLCSKVVHYFLQSLNPSLNFQVENVQSIPIIENIHNNFRISNIISEKIISISEKDWNSYETSWDFTSLPLLQKEYKKSSLEESYKTLRAFWQTQVDTMKKLEEENNDIFIKAYGLEDELKPEVPLKEITLTCNPAYRYDAKKSTEELEVLLLADTVREYISYAVGVMFGRYSLDHDGLHIANQDESIEEANAKFGITNPIFEADSDNVIPILDGEWFIDDISERFFQFVKVTFGKESYEANLDFIANALSDKNKNSVETIRKYFLKDFYTDHVKRYKKRPIYWMISSPKGSFQALIYMHRYKSDTMSVVLNDYLREFITKLEATRENLEAVSIKSDASGSEKTKALKEIENIKKMIKELREFEKDVLYPLATEKIEIDLDDGVKVNYPKFGSALKKIAGLDSEE